MNEKPNHIGVCGNHKAGEAAPKGLPFCIVAEFLPTGEHPNGSYVVLGEYPNLKTAMTALPKVRRDYKRERSLPVGVCRMCKVRHKGGMQCDGEP